jgi:hypothetical protein
MHPLRMTREQFTHFVDHEVLRAVRIAGERWRR